MSEKRAKSRHKNGPFTQLWVQLRQDNASLSNKTWVKANVCWSSEWRTRELIMNNAPQFICIFHNGSRFKDVDVTQQAAKMAEEAMKPAASLMLTYEDR